jgi:hypothetical protein
MVREPTGVETRARRLRVVSRTSIAAGLVGVFSTWATAGPVTLNGVEGPNNGWLVVLVALSTLVWTRWMEHGSWVGVVGVLGSAVVMCATALEDWSDNRDVLGASVGWGLLLVVVASIALGVTALLRGVELLRSTPAT